MTKLQQIRDTLANVLAKLAAKPVNEVSAALVKPCDGTSSGKGPPMPGFYWEPTQTLNPPDQDR